MSVGKLYIVSTPLGNLEDITLRALRILKEVPYIAAEDTRHTRKLLNHFDIGTPSISYHEHNKLEKLGILLALLKEGHDLALVSDAGTPCVNDPGWELVKACIEQDIPVDSIPGPAALIDAMVLSGFSLREFTFVGFPPRQKNEQREWFANFKTESSKRPLAFFEAPHRLESTLEIALGILGDRPVAVARELTKLHQEVRRELLSETLAHLKETPPRGEYTIVLGVPDAKGAEANAASTGSQGGESPAERLLKLKNSGARAKQAVEAVSIETGLSRRQVYEIWLSLG